MGRVPMIAVVLIALALAIGYAVVLFRRATPEDVAEVAGPQRYKTAEAALAELPRDEQRAWSALFDGIQSEEQAEEALAELTRPQLVALVRIGARRGGCTTARRDDLPPFAKVSGKAARSLQALGYACLAPTNPAAGRGHHVTLTDAGRVVYRFAHDVVGLTPTRLQAEERARR